MEWISVEERLPCMEEMAGESISVIGWFVGGVLPEGDMCFCVYDEDDGFTDEDGDLNDHITHWMPLPEPPTN